MQSYVDEFTFELKKEVLMKRQWLELLLWAVTLPVINAGLVGIV
jgi:hypothetical protein